MRSIAGIVNLFCEQSHFPSESLSSNSRTFIGEGFYECLIGPSTSINCRQYRRNQSTGKTSMTSMQPGQVVE